MYQFEEAIAERDEVRAWRQQGLRSYSAINYARGENRRACLDLVKGCNCFVEEELNVGRFVGKLD